MKTNSSLIPIHRLLSEVSGIRSKFPYLSDSPAAYLESMSRTHVLFVTGKLAEPSLRRTANELAPRAGFEFSVAVLPITVAALATTEWIARHLQVPAGTERILIPGLCTGDVAIVTNSCGVPVERGPKDLRDLPEHFGETSSPSPGYGNHDIAILAEINHVPRLARHEILAQARAYRAAGADVVDLGCDPGETCMGIGDIVRELRDEGLRISIDSFDSMEIDLAVATGAELVLSVNSSNLPAARSWGCEVVAIPDVAATLKGLDQTVEALAGWNVPFRIDPILEPIGFGFAASLGRFLEVRRRYPQAEMLMGIGNLTELTDVDSAGVNAMLLGFCQELGIRSVLTTEVINWCRSSVRELDLARRLIHYACKQHVLPKKLEPDLIVLRDPKVREHGEQTLTELATSVTDPNFRLFAERGLLHVINGQMYLRGTDPFSLFEKMTERGAIKPDHAFYLGYEMAKAMTALTLGKNYMQDQALRWGFLTREEQSHGPTIHDGSSTS
jgi:dihydropteroate synthase